MWKESTQPLDCTLFKICEVKICAVYTCLGVVPSSHFTQVAGFLSLGCGWGRRVNSMVSSTLWRSTQSCGGNHPPWFPVGLDTVVSNMGVVCDFRYALGEFVCYIYKRVWGQHPWYPLFLLKPCKHAIKVNCMFWTLYSITWDESLGTADKALVWNNGSLLCKIYFNRNISF